MTKEARARARGMLEEWARTAYPDASEIPEDPEAAEAMQRQVDRQATIILDMIIREGLI
jgi:hypothetical protein